MVGLLIWGEGESGAEVLSRWIRQNWFDVVLALPVAGAWAIMTYPLVETVLYLGWVILVR